MIRFTQIPQFDQLMQPLINALKTLGGSGRNDEIYEKVLEQCEIPDEIVDTPHGENGSLTEVEYRLAWARTYLKTFGLIENSVRGVWTLTSKGKEIDKVDTKAIVKYGRAQVPSKSKKKETKKEIEVEGEESWRSELHEVLLKLDPAAFERLAQRILRESGFVQVDVTGRSGDGGIDGKGIVRINGFLNFHVMFQCKRYSGSVGSGHIRDFRGAMMGRTDKGLFITTGTFTRDAITEANRDGVPPIDLLDGESLIEKLKELSLGVTTKMVEQVEVDNKWFGDL